jgi:hypothetical protein
MNMCIQAEVLRSRADNVARRFARSTDATVRAMADSIVQAYEALAQNEEWLAGAVSPRRAAANARPE